MISYEDARQIREKANAPLTWDEADLDMPEGTGRIAWKEATPAPPLDRIELTRRILETAEMVGLDLSDWDEPLSLNDPERKIEQFQEQLRPLIPKQSTKGVPTIRVSFRESSGLRDEVFGIACVAYIRELEADYLQPWETSWRYGVCAEAKENVLFLLQEGLADPLKKIASSLSGGSRQYDSPKINESEVIATECGTVVGVRLFNHLRREAGLELRLVQTRWFGLPEVWALGPPLLLGLFCLIGSVAGVVQGRYSGWLLLVLVPAILIGTFVVSGKFSDMKTDHWLNPQMTFDELAEKVVTLKKREWAELQQTYTT